MSKLIIGATDPELSFLLDRLECRKERNFCDFRIYHATFNKRDIYVVKSGPGIANAAAATSFAVDRYRITPIYNVGVCGVYADEPGLLGTVVVGSIAVFADTGVETEKAFLPMSAVGLPLAKLRDGTKIFNIVTLNNDHVHRDILRSDFATVSVISGSSQAAKKIKQRFKVDPGVLLCEDMETAAVGLVALKASIPCTVFRGISNIVGQRDRSSWKLTEAADQAQKTLIQYL